MRQALTSIAGAQGMCLRLDTACRGCALLLRLIAMAPRWSGHALLGTEGANGLLALVAQGSSASRLAMDGLSVAGGKALRLALLLAGLCLGNCALALNPSTPIGSYGLTHWGMDEGLPQSLVQVIEQSSDGYLWLGLQGGLARFDGVRFETFNSRDVPQLASSSIQSLDAAADGGVWVGTRGGLTSVRLNGRQLSWSAESAFGTAAVSGVIDDGVGNVWVTGSKRGLQRWASGARSVPSAESVLTPGGAVGDSRVTVSQSSSGEIWAATRREGLQRRVGGDWIVVVPPERLGDVGVLSILVRRNGEVWLGTMDGTVSVFQADGSGGSTLRVDPSGGAIYALREDRDGNVWIGAVRSGLHRWQGGDPVDPGAGRLARFVATEWPTDLSVFALHEDREGNLWVGTSHGLYRLRDTPLLTLSAANGLAVGPIWSIRGDTRGNIWASSAAGTLHQMTRTATLQFDHTYQISGGPVYSIAVDESQPGLLLGTSRGGLLNWRDGRPVPVVAGAAFTDAAVSAVFRDSRQRVWVGGSMSDGLHYLSVNGPQVLGNAQGFDGVASAFAEAADSAIWIGTRNHGAYRYRSDGVLEHWDHRRGLGLDSVVAIYADSEETIWIATMGAGLHSYRHGQIKMVVTRSDVRLDSVLSMLEDNAGRLWLCTLNGLYALDRQQLYDAVDRGWPVRQVRAFGREDGFLASECSGGGQGHAWKAPDGRLWFATDAGVVVADPAAITTNSVKAPVHLERVSVDERLVESPEDLVLAAGNHRIGFQFTGISLQAPTRVRFRHRLDGFDTDWIEGVERSVSYTSLAPGKYRFQVTASNSDGLWNPVPATLNFSVDAPFYASKWFYALLASALGAIGWGGYHVRLLQLRAQNAVLTERNRIARELHDTVAQGLVGIKVQISVASELVGSAQPQLQERLIRAQQIADESIEEARQSVWALRGTPALVIAPLAAIARMVRTLVEASAVALTLDADGESAPMDGGKHQELARLVREAVVNVLRHARATQLRLRIRADRDGVMISVSDDGCGFDVQAVSGRSMGLRGMHERAERIGATLIVRSEAQVGTEVVVVINGQS